jgi:hypothetical protein
MHDPLQKPVLLSRPGPYRLPDGLRFVGLGRPQDKEIIRIRLSRGPATTLDIPVSAEALADLAHALCPLYGSTPEQIADNLADLQQKGLQLLD